MNQLSVGVVGLGYVGLPLAMEFCRKGFHVYGVDSDADKVSLLTAGQSYVGDVADSAVRESIAAKQLEVSTSPAGLRNVSAISICVPTPLTKTKDPDMTFVVRAAETVAKILQPGQVVILESTVYPGATEELVAPILEKSGLRLDSGFFLAFSPERVDPGNRQYRLSEIPKVVGGVTEKSTQKAAELYGQVFTTVLRTSVKEAEMTKLLENTFRAVNIGLMNELALVTHKMGVNVWNVIDAAATKPFGFMPFYPGPGLGGHCIPIDPLYLTWKVRMFGTDIGFIELADRINSRMPEYIVDRIADLLNDQEKAVRGARIMLLGVAYKRDVADTRESPALDILGMLSRKGAIVSYSDPYVPHVEVLGQSFDSHALDGQLLSTFDCVVITTDHSAFDWQLVVDSAHAVLDTRNATKHVRGNHEHVRVL